MPYLTTISETVLALMGAVVLGSDAYLLTLLGAAALGRRAPTTPGEKPRVGTRFAVLVPAHDEEMVLAATLESLDALDYPADRREIIVIADNCTDATAEIARRHGVTVWERADRDRRGKGYALEWALGRLLARPETPDAVVIVDADTWVARDFLSEAVRGLERGTDAGGRCALQGRYGVLNPDDGWRATLMSAALDLFNHVKPLGRDRLGLSVGLKGNGMVFSRSLLETARWRGDSVTEDIDFGLDLAREHGVRVGYLPTARVLAQMPATAEQAATQRARWEGGRYRLVRERALPLLAEGLRRRSGLLLDAALDLLLPPLAEIGALWALWGCLLGVVAALHLVGAPVAWAAAWAAGGAGLLLYILGGLRVAEAPRAAYTALLRAPLYAAWKLILYAQKFGRPRRGQAARAVEWVRTGTRPDAAGRCGAESRKQGRVNIVLPIVFFAVAVGLSVRRMTPALWALMIAWIVAVVVYNYLKH